MMQAGNSTFFQMNPGIVEVSTGNAQEHHGSGELYAQDLVTDKAELARIARVRSERWKEEQTLVADSGRYIRPITITEIPAMGTATLKLPSQPFHQKTSDWFTGVILITLLLAATVRNSFDKYLSALFMSTVNYPAASRLFREQNISLRQGAMILEIFFLLIMGLFAYQLVLHFGGSLPVSGILLYLICFGAVLLFFMLKEFIYRLLGFISETGAETSEYIFTMKIYNKMTGIFLLPIVCFLAWAPVGNPTGFIVAGLVIIALLYLKSLQRGMKILLKKQFSVFYLFLYLCTLEFLPLLLFIKAI